MDQCCGLCRSSKTVTTDPFFPPDTHTHAHMQAESREFLPPISELASPWTWPCSVRVFLFFCLFLFWTLPGPQAAVASAAISDPECRRAGLVGPRGRRSARGSSCSSGGCLRCHTLCAVSAVPGLTEPSARQKPQRGWNVAMADVDAVRDPPRSWPPQPSASRKFPRKNLKTFTDPQNPPFSLKPPAHVTSSDRLKKDRATSSRGERSP